MRSMCPNLERVLVSIQNPLGYHLDVEEFWASSLSQRLGGCQNWHEQLGDSEASQSGDHTHSNVNLKSKAENWTAETKQMTQELGRQGCQFKGV